MSRRICPKTFTCPGEHGARRTQHQRSDGRSDHTCSTCHCPNAQVRQHQAQATQHAQRPTVSVRHSVVQETPVPTYIVLMLHTHTRKRELIDNMAHMGLSTSYDRVLRLSTQMGNKVCQQFHHEQAVCPPKLRGNVFTTAAVDNIDHNPSSTTAKKSFHSTEISLFQHPSFAEEGLSRIIVRVAGSGDASCHVFGKSSSSCMQNGAKWDSAVGHFGKWLPSLSERKFLVAQYPDFFVICGSIFVPNLVLLSQNAQLV